MTDYETFCERWQLDPSLSSSKLEYEEARKAMEALQRAAAKAEAAEAIEKAKSQ